MKRLLIIPLTLMLVGNLTSSCSSSTSKDKEQADSIAAAELEAARLDSIRQDSIERVNFTSPDLAFHELHGHVKQCNDLIFDEKGNWSNMPKAEWTEYEIRYNPELQNMPIYERDKDGRIFRENRVSDYEGIIQQKYEWTDGRISAIKTDSELENVSLVYDDNGLLKTKRQESHGGEGWQYYVITYTYSDYKFDSYNNWIKRQVSTTQYTIDDIGNKKYGEEEHYTETRTITYYKSNGGEHTSIPNSTKQEQALQALNSYEKKQEEKNNIPDWMQGTWHLDINGPNGIAVANYTITIDGNYATMSEGSRTKYSGECHIDNGKLYLGNSSSFDINGQSLYYRQYRLTKDGNGASWSGSFRTDSDVMRYLTDHTFYSDSHRMSFTYNSCKIDGYTVSGAPLISSVSSSSATIVVNPIGGGSAVYLYLNASNGTINYDGDIFRAR